MKLGQRNPVSRIYLGFYISRTMAFTRDAFEFKSTYLALLFCESSHSLNPVLTNCNPICALLTDALRLFGNIVHPDDHR